MWFLLFEQSKHLNKNQKKRKAEADLMNKNAAYQDWVKFNKLMEQATDEHKELFVKKAKGENRGKESFYSVAKTEARLVSETLQNNVNRQKFLRTTIKYPQDGAGCLSHFVCEGGHEGRQRSNLSG